MTVEKLLTDILQARTEDLYTMARLIRENRKYFPEKTTSPAKKKKKKRKVAETKLDVDIKAAALVPVDMDDI